MADLVITPSSVLPPVSARLANGLAGEAVVAGLFLYFKPSDSLWWKADCLTLEKCGGLDLNYLKIAMGDASAGQPVPLLNPGQIVTVNAVLTKGRIYSVSSTSVGGKIFLASELVATNILAEIGYAISTTQLYFSPIKSGVIL